VKKDPDGNFLFLPFESPKMPKSIKREVTNKEIFYRGKTTKFSEHQCKICQKYFCNMRALKKHTELHFQPSSFDCKRCKKTFKRKYKFNAHKCVKKSERHFCSFCDKNFSLSETLKTHMKKFHSEKMTVNLYCCDFCDRKFFDKYKLKVHIEGFLCRKIFDCDHCGKEFHAKKDISQHVLTHAKFKVECEICYAQVKPKSLYIHMRFIHHESKKVECKICKKVFKYSSNLKKHEKIHEKKQFGCQVCEFKFSLKGHLNQHMKFHENPDQFKCQICGQQLTSKQGLEFHLRTHDKNREKNLKCNQCDYKTDNKQSLKVHLKIHEKLNEKLKKFPNAIKCEKCFSVLISKSSYRKHKRRHHGNRQKIQCDICGLKVYKPSLEKHFASKHQNKIK
jgi:KRAB domain-containing zinc finger protein